MKKLLALNRGRDRHPHHARRDRTRFANRRDLLQEDRLSLHRFKPDEAYEIGEGKGPV